jgi:hypothetical protein
MQITSTTLRRIIKEELDAIMNEAEGSEAQVVADMAAGLAEVPAVQAAVERARQDPDVQAALADLMASRDALAEELGLGPSKYQTAMGLAAGGGLLGMAGLLATSNAAAVAPFLAAVAPLAAPLGLAGPALLALSVLIASGKDK